MSDDQARSELASEQHCVFDAYDSDRMVILFTIKKESGSLSCAISTDALDVIDGSRVKENARKEQFDRLRGKIAEQAWVKIRAGEFERKSSGIVLRAIDFRPSR